MREEFEFECPYCGTKQNMVYDDDDGEPERRVTLCWPVNGGCNKYFVVMAMVKVVTMVYKIEGENK